MNRIKILVAILVCGAALPISAQTSSGSVTVQKDPRVDLLVSKQIEINELTTRNARRYAPGFRILVISSNNRNKVIDAKTKVYREFPELKAYMMYQSPFFKLKLGNFKERTEAEEYLGDIQKIFPSGVYIVPDTIEVRPDKDGDIAE
ncbi:MAG: SPOR domain-containing protein [Flavitalea sp.]